MFIGSFPAQLDKLWKDEGGSLLARKERKCGKPSLFASSRQSGKLEFRNKIAFEDVMLSIQKLKSSFVYFLWEKTKMCIKEGPTTLVDFFEWLGSI